jgi:hypothetical protein
MLTAHGRHLYYNSLIESDSAQKYSPLIHFNHTNCQMENKLNHQSHYLLNVDVSDDLAEMYDCELGEFDTSLSKHRISKHNYGTIIVIGIMVIVWLYGILSEIK